jgi:decaprenylphospho-beta-D-erythro-pentofuranosid-2-ulose 2-reductase
MRFKNIIIYGGTSQVAINLINFYLNECEKIIVFCRSAKKFKEIMANHNNLSGEIEIIEIDLSDLNKNLEIIKTFSQNISGIFWISGFTGNADIEYQNISEAKNNLTVNFFNPIIIINELSKKMIKNHNSFIVAFTSVAGLRGRKKQLFYSAAKSGLISYLSGLRQKLYLDKIHVMTVIPGYMNTEPFKKGNWNAPKFLITEPNKVAFVIKRSLIKKREIIYINFYWFLIMNFLKIIPEKIFKKLKF